MKKVVYALLSVVLLISCKEEQKEKNDLNAAPIQAVVEAPVLEEFGYNLYDYKVVRDTVRSGDSFGAILDSHGIERSKVFEISNTIRDTFNVAKIVAGKPYTILKSKDTTERAQIFVYQNNAIDYTVIDFTDSIIARKDQKPVKLVEKVASGTIESSLLQTFSDINVNAAVAYKMADIYAWTIDFTRLQVGDRFKVIYNQKFIEDTIPSGIEDIKGVYFEHRGKPIYAFSFVGDTINNVTDYYDENAKNLRRAFLKGPLKFNRVSSRYNLKRRIKYYGYKVRPHRGTDFAGPVGTPIMATSDGIVTKSERRGGNGKYVRIRHNSTYETQYLHMSRQAVKVGDYVRQGDVIGYIGMTGNTGGPHVCYRFWKNGRQVDPFREDLPASKPLEKELQPKFFEHIKPMKAQLDSINFKRQEILL
ncbi:peptidoglycan DD-metalloendopeptidase family protein [Aquimarina rhabdastrellae]